MSIWTHLLGLDFGISDRNGLTVAAWRANDPCVYFAESYKLQAIPSEMAAEVKRLDATYRFAQIVGDIGGMGKAFAEEMIRRHSIPVQAAQKHNKLGYIALMNGDLERGLIKVVRAKCQDLIAEWAELSWTADRMHEVAGQENHCADSALYIWRAANSFHERNKADAPPMGSDAYWAAEQQRLEQAAEDEFAKQQREAEWEP